MVVALLDLVVMFSFFLSRLVSMMCIVGVVIGLILVYLVLWCCWVLGNIIFFIFFWYAHGVGNRNKIQIEQCSKGTFIVKQDVRKSYMLCHISAALCPTMRIKEGNVCRSITFNKN